MSWIQVWWSEADDSVTCFLNLMMYELGITSEFDEERMGAASPWMVWWLAGAATAQAANERAIRPLMVTEWRRRSRSTSDF
jgi:hypothetical protein